MPSLGRLGAQRDDRHAGLDPDPHGQREVVVRLVQLLDHLQDPQRAEDGAFRVVLVRDGGAEHGHHRVADELLDGAAEPLDLPADAARGTVASVSWTSSGSARSKRDGELDEVAEQDRDDLAFLASAAAGVQCAAAGRTVVRGLRIAMSAGPTDRHGRSVDRAQPRTGQARARRP